MRKEIDAKSCWVERERERKREMRKKKKMRETREEHACVYVCVRVRACMVACLRMRRRAYERKKQETRKWDKRNVETLPSQTIPDGNTRMEVSFPLDGREA